VFPRTPGWSRSAPTIKVGVAMEETFGLQDYSDETVTASVDPVCGRSVDESRAAAKTGYAGQVYYFCSKDCQKIFEENPGDYIGQEK
jgi:YHS domain-containing protein